MYWGALLKPLSDRRKNETNKNLSILQNYFYNRKKCQKILPKKMCTYAQKKNGKNKFKAFMSKMRTYFYRTEKEKILHEKVSQHLYE